MSVIEITDAQSGSTAAIAVDAGFNCFQFVPRAGDLELSVIHSPEEFEDGTKTASLYGIPVLFPFPNRIRGGRYTWDGRSWELPEQLVSYDRSGNAIHGFCLDRPWRILVQTDSSVTGIFQLSQDAEDRRSLWPADAELTVCYSIQGTTLRAEFTVRNPDKVPLPWGLGTHPYFRLPLSDEESTDHCTVFAPTHRIWQLKSWLPTGRIIDAPEGETLDQSPKFNSIRLDGVYTDLKASGNAIESRVTDMRSGWSVVQRSSVDFRELVAFTPPWTTAVCLEPYTCTTDAINLQSDEVDTGLKVLPPGESWTGWNEIEARR